MDEVFALDTVWLRRAQEWGGVWALTYFAMCFLPVKDPKAPQVYLLGLVLATILHFLSTGVIKDRARRMGGRYDQEKFTFPAE